MQTKFDKYSGVEPNFGPKIVIFGLPSNFFLDYLRDFFELLAHELTILKKSDKRNWSPLGKRREENVLDYKLSYLRNSRFKQLWRKISEP